MCTTGAASIQNCPIDGVALRYAPQEDPRCTLSVSIQFWFFLNGNEFVAEAGNCALADFEPAREIGLRGGAGSKSLGAGIEDLEQVARRAC